MISEGKFKKRLLSVLKYTFLILVTIWSVFPLFWMLMASTNLSIDISRGKSTFGTSLLTNYNILIKNSNLWRAMWNSIRNSVCLTILSVLICSIAGYGFELYHDKWKDRLMKILMISMMVPFAATMIPLFSMMGSLGLINTTLGFALPTLSTVFLIFLFRQSSRNFPYEIIEAARIEGMGELGIFFKIFMPIMKPTYAAGITVVFMNSWNSYLWPLIILQSPSSQTMPILVSNITSSYVTDYGVLMLGVSLSTIPTIFIFFVLQRYFAEGITGAVK